MKAERNREIINLRSLLTRRTNERNRYQLIAIIFFFIAIVLFVGVLISSIINSNKFLIDKNKIVNQTECIRGNVYANQIILNDTCEDGIKINYANGTIMPLKVIDEVLAKCKIGEYNLNKEICTSSQETCWEECKYFLRVSNDYFYSEDDLKTKCAYLLNTTTDNIRIEDDACVSILSDSLNVGYWTDKICQTKCNITYIK